MAFDLNGLGRLSSTMNENSMVVWSYKTTDTMATVTASGYFDSISIKVNIGDKLFVETSDDDGIIRVATLGVVTVDVIPEQVSTTINTTTDAASAFAVQNIRLEVVELGDMVTISWPQLVAAPTQATDIRVVGLSGTWLPAIQADQPIAVFDNNVEKIGSIQVDVGGLMIFSNGIATASTFTFPGANVGISGGSISYNKKI